MGCAFWQAHHPRQARPGRVVQAEGVQCMNITEAGLEQLVPAHQAVAGLPSWQREHRGGRTIASCVARDSVRGLGIRCSHVECAGSAEGFTGSTTWSPPPSSAPPEDKWGQAEPTGVSDGPPLRPQRAPGKTKVCFGGVDRSRLEGGGGRSGRGYRAGAFKRPTESSRTLRWAGPFPPA